MFAAAWLILSGLLYSLQLSSGSFPKPLTPEEERHYLALAAQGDLEARNVLIERNLRLVSHILKKYYANASDQEDLLERFSSKEQLRQLCKAVDTVLDPQEREVIVLRYGLGSGTPRRQREVAALTGISRSYVSRIEKRALGKLRKALEE